MTIKQKSFNERLDKKDRVRKPTDHKAGKHLRNALRSNHFYETLDDDELDELGFYDAGDMYDE